MRRYFAALVAACVVGSLSVAVAPAGSTPATGGPVGTTGLGYWEPQSDGRVVAVGDAAGSATSVRSKGGIVGIAAVPGGQGYWLAGAGGGVFPFGSAHAFGSLAGVRLHRPIVGIAATPSGRGYWLVASDGGVFSFGDAHFYGSTGSLPLHRPIVGIAATASGRGYWLVASDGGIFTFGDARFYGSDGATRLAAPVAAMAATHEGRGYWLVGQDGTVHRFGDAVAYGSARNRLATPVVGITPSPTGLGYLVVSRFGAVAAFGDATSCFPFSFPFPGPVPIRGPFFGANATVGLAIPYDPAAIHSFMAGTCGGVSKAFRPTAPWHIEFGAPGQPANDEYFYCQVSLLRANATTGDVSTVLENVQAQGEGRIEVRAAQMDGNTTVRISSGGSCTATAREGTGGTQSLPFSFSSGGDSLPFTSASSITIDGASLNPCQVEVFSDADGHFVDGHYGSHSHLVEPPGTYFLESTPDCDLTVK